MSCDCYVSLLHGAVLSAMCDCDIFWSYSLYKSIVNDWHIFVISDKRRGPRCRLTGNKTVTIYFIDMRTIIEIPIEEI